VKLSLFVYDCSVLLSLKCWTGSETETESCGFVLGENQSELKLLFSDILLTVFAVVKCDIYS